jgi:hypothetical protein
VAAGRALAWVGRVHGREVELFPVAWCQCCGADRILVNPRPWPGDWGQDQPSPIGECISCNNTIAITSRKPSEAA